MRICCRGPSLAVHTPAKLNLSLEVLGRRPDGYHELETVMVSIGLYDTLLFTEDRAHETRLRCHSVVTQSRHRSELSSGPDNLIVQAAELLRQTTGCDRGVTIDLWKRIPMQAGLGGGSSDAAATLVGLNRFWQLGLSSSELHDLASQLGSDVNFFLDSPIAANARGVGNRSCRSRFLSDCTLSSFRLRLGCRQAKSSGSGSNPPEAITYRAISQRHSLHAEFMRT